MRREFARDLKREDGGWFDLWRMRGGRKRVAWSTLNLIVQLNWGQIWWAFSHVRKHYQKLLEKVGHMISFVISFFS